MHDPFHEAKVALAFAKLERVQVNSVSACSAYTINHACENAFRTLYQISTEEPFPREAFKPFHKPASYVQRTGLVLRYSTDTRQFVDKLNGYALDEVRYEGTQAYKDHTKPAAANRGKVLIDGAERFIAETEQLAKKEEVRRMLKNFDEKLKRKEQANK